MGQLYALHGNRRRPHHDISVADGWVPFEDNVLAAALGCHGSPVALILANVRLQSPRQPHLFLFQQADGSFANVHGESARDQTLSVALGRIGASARMRVQDFVSNRLFGDEFALRFSAVPEPGYCPATSRLTSSQSQSSTEKITGMKKIAGNGDMPCIMRHFSDTSTIRPPKRIGKRSGIYRW